MPHLRKKYIFPNNWVAGGQDFEVAVLEKHNIAVANVVPDSLFSVNFPLATHPPRYSADDFDALVDQYQTALSKVSDTKIGSELLDVIANGRPLERTFDNQWAYQTEGGSPGLSSTQLVIFPAKGAVNTGLPLRVQSIDINLPDSNSGSATSLIYDLDYLFSELDSQGRLFLNDPMSTFFHELVHVPQDVFGLTPKNDLVIQMASAQLSVFEGELGDGRYPRQIIEEFSTEVPVMETLTHGGQVGVAEMRQSLIDRGRITADDYPDVRHNPYAKKALDTARANHASADQIHARWLYYTTNPTEIRFADETNAIVRESYLSGRFVDEEDQLIENLPKFVLNEDVSAFDIQTKDLLDPDSSSRLKRLEAGLPSPVCSPFGNISGESSDTIGNVGSGAANTLVYDGDRIVENIGGLRRYLSLSDSRLDQIDHVQASLDTLSQGQAAAATQNRLTQLLDINRRASNAISRAIDALDLATTQFLDGDRQQAQRFSI
ncbi:hypothetical protein [Mycobacterium sp.]|uniref:hypothetical protein n=1 Tax=Mycobacterium sp. TaxID=1785 RepID=UPI003BAC0083